VAPYITGAIIALVAFIAIYTLFKAGFDQVFPGG